MRNLDHGAIRDTLVADSPIVPGSPSRAVAALRRLCRSALAIALAMGAILEYAVFRHGSLLADQSTVAIAYKGARLEEGHSEHVIVIGPSTALAIDAAALQRATRTAASVYNYALPNLGSAEQYYFILKKYLKFNRRPDRIVLALPPDTILSQSAEQSDPVIQAIERQRFRRFLGPTFLLTDVATTTRQWSFAAEALETMLPSVNYRIFIKNGTFARDADQVSDWEEFGSVGALYRRNRRIIERLEATNGQLVYNGDRVVGEAEVARAMPPAPSAYSRDAASLEQTIRLADAAGIPITLLFTPVCCERDRALSDNRTWELLRTLVGEYARRYPSFRFVDLGERSYEREWFGDAVHVNERGAVRLTNDLIAQLPDILPAPSEP